MIDSIMRRSLFKKIISLLIIPTFLFSNIAFAAPDKPLSDLPKTQEMVTNPEKVVIPREFGLVKSKFTGNSGKLVIHIQDAHCNYEAQGNIVKILESLVRNDGLSLVSVEGADGIIDTSWFKAFPDDEVRKEVADYFMKKGEITGPEFLSITTNLPIKLFGAETRSYYIQNLNAFTSSYPLKSETEKFYNQIKNAFNRLKILIYNDELKLLDAKMQDYESKKLPFNDYVRLLQWTAEKHKINLRQYENFFRLVSVLIYEKKIDFNVTDRERSALIDKLSKALPKESLEELVNQSISFKANKISSAEYYGYLKALAIKNGIDMAQEYPNLYNYIIYNSAYSKIENEKLFADIKKLETDIKEKLFANDDQRELEKLSRHVDTLLGLINIKLMNGDFDYYLNNKSEFSNDAFIDFIKKKTAQYGLAYEVDPPNEAAINSIQKLEDFYSIAIKRDKALVDNTLSQMKKEKSPIAVLITGGFHSEGITKLLEKQGVSYLVICPSITKDVQTPYIQILTNQRTPLEDILVGATAHAKEGMVSPMLMSQYVGLNSKRLEKLRGEFVPLEGQTPVERVTRFKDGWAIISVKGLKSVKGSKRVAAINIKGIVEHMIEEGKLKTQDDIEAAIIRGITEKCASYNIDRQTRDGLIELVKSQFPSIRKEFAPDFAKLQKAAAAQEKLAARRKGKAARTSPGRQAGAGEGERPLVAGKFQLYDDYLAKDFAVQGNLAIDDEFDDELRICVHGNMAGSFENGIADANLAALKRNRPTIPFSRVHPGTWRGKAFTRTRGGRTEDILGQIHVSGYVWNSSQNPNIGRAIAINDYDKSVTVIHEKVHLKIWRKMGKEYKLWQLYLKYCGVMKISLDQEDFVDNIGNWAERLTGWAKDPRDLRGKALKTSELSEWARANDIPLSYRKSDFSYQTNLTRVRQKMAQIQHIRILTAAKDAIITSQTPRSDEFLKVLVEAYQLAVNYGDNNILGHIMNFVFQPKSWGSVYRQKVEMCRNAFVQLAAWYPVLLHKDLFSTADREAIAAINAWTNELSGKSAVDPKKDVAVVIMAGGGGERIWPLSNQTTPKQIAAILDELLLNITVTRVIETVGKENIYIQTTRKLKDKIIRIFQETGIDIPLENIFTEPEQADTAGAIGYAAAKLSQLGRGSDAMFVCTADHFIETAGGVFERSYLDAARIARTVPAIGTIGIEPTAVSEDYGCIKKGSQTFFTGEGAVLAERFREKPKGKAAEDVYKEMQPDGKTHAWLWNSGMFVATPTTFLRAFRDVAPAYGEVFDVIADKSATPAQESAAFMKLVGYKKQGWFPHTGEATGKRSGVSVDFVLAEPLSRTETDRIGLFMMPSDFRWLDIGGYRAVWEYYVHDYLRAPGVRASKKGVVKDDSDNVIVNTKSSTHFSNITLENCKNCLVITDDMDMKIALKDLENAIVIYNPETKALLVAPLFLTALGDYIKEMQGKLSDQQKAIRKGGLKGYITGNVDQIARIAKTVPIRCWYDAETDMLTADRTPDSNAQELYGEGDGVFIRSEQCAMAVSFGFGAVIGMKNIFLEMKPLSNDSKSCSVEVRGYRDAFTAETAPAQIFAGAGSAAGISAENPQEARINELSLMAEWGYVDLAAMTAAEYAALYSIEESQAETEFKSLKERIAALRTQAALAKAEAIFPAQAVAAKSEDPTGSKALDNLRLWLTDKRFREYQPALLDLIDLAVSNTDVAKELYGSFYTTIAFGTGGRRWKMGIGPNRMNAFMAAITAQGHIEYLRQQYPEEFARGDAMASAWDVRAFRKYYAETPALKAYRKIIEAKCPALSGISSEDLSKIAALVYAGNGVTYLHSVEMRSTPWQSFVVKNFSRIVRDVPFKGLMGNILNRIRNAMGGIVLSSSHNPYDNNGTKFYENSGAQAPPQIVQKLMNLGNSVEAIKYWGGDMIYEKGLQETFKAAVRAANKAVENDDVRLGEAGYVVTLEGDNLKILDDAYADNCIDEVRSMYPDRNWQELLPLMARLVVSFHALNGTGATAFMHIVKRMEERFGVKIPAERSPSPGDMPSWDFRDADQNIPNPESEKSFNAAMEIGVRRTLNWVYSNRVTTVKAVIDEDNRTIPIAELENDRKSAFTSTEELIGYMKSSRAKYIRGVILNVTARNRAGIEEFNRANSICLMTDPDADRVGLGMLKMDISDTEARLHWVSANDNDESGIVLFTYRLEKLRDMANDGKGGQKLIDYIVNERKNQADGKDGRSSSGTYQLVVVNTIVSNPLEARIAKAIAEDIERLTNGKVTVKIVTHHVGFKFTGEIIDNINNFKFRGITGELMRDAGVNLDQNEQPEDKALFVLSSEEGEGSLIGFKGSIDKDSGVTGFGLFTLAAELSDQDKTIYDYLNGIYANPRYGYSKTYIEPIVLTDEYGKYLINKVIMPYWRDKVLPAVLQHADNNLCKIGPFTLTAGQDHYDLVRRAEQYRVYFAEILRDPGTFAQVVIADLEMKEKDKALVIEAASDPSPQKLDELRQRLMSDDYNRTVDPAQVEVVIQLLKDRDNGNNVQLMINNPWIWPQAIRESVNILEFDAVLEDGTTVKFVLRPSGTEPKHKNFVAVDGMPRGEGEPLNDYIERVNKINADAVLAVTKACYKISDATYNSKVQEQQGERKINNLSDEDMLELILIAPISVSCEAKLGVYFPLRDYVLQVAADMAGETDQAVIKAKYDEMREMIAKYLVYFHKETGIKFVEKAIMFNLTRQLNGVQNNVAMNDNAVRAIYYQAVLWFGAEIGSRNFKDLLTKRFTTLAEEQLASAMPSIGAAQTAEPTMVATSQAVTVDFRRSPGMYAASGEETPAASAQPFDLAAFVAKVMNAISLLPEDIEKNEAAQTALAAKVAEVCGELPAAERERVTQAVRRQVAATRLTTRLPLQQATAKALNAQAPAMQAAVKLDTDTGELTFGNPLYAKQPETPTSYRDRGWHDFGYVVSRLFAGLVNLGRWTYNICYSMTHFGDLHAATTFGLPVIPNSPIYPCTGSHSQGATLDIKLMKVPGIQQIPVFNGNRELVSYRYMLLNPGEIAFSLPGTIDIYTAVTGGVQFADRSVPLTGEQYERALKTIADLLRIDVETLKNTKLAENLPSKGMPYIFYRNQSGETRVTVNPVYRGRVPEMPLVCVKPYMPKFKGKNLSEYAELMFNPANIERYNANEEGLKVSIESPEFALDVVRHIVSIESEAVINKDVPLSQREIQLRETFSRNRNRAAGAFQKVEERVNEGRAIGHEPFLMTGRQNYTWGHTRDTSLKQGGILYLVQKALKQIVFKPFERRNKIDNNSIISERWICAGDINVGFNLPIEVLQLFPAFFGQAHLEEYGPNIGITAKHLTSRVPLSVQTHDFDEMLVAQGEGHAFIGLNKEEIKKKFDGREELTPEETLRVLLTGEIEGLMNRVELKKGDVYHVPAGTIHSYGIVNVFEVKSVTAEGDKAGTRSLCDRLKLADARLKTEIKEHVSALLTAGKTFEEIQTETRAWLKPKLIEYGYPPEDVEKEKVVRDKKDVLTMSPAKVKENIKAVQGSGGLKGINPESLKAAPLTVSENTTMASKLELLSTNTGFVSERFTFGKVGGILKADTLAAVSPHTLFVKQGSVDIVYPSGKREKLREGSERSMPATVGKYEIYSLEPNTVVYSQYKPLSAENMVVAGFEVLLPDLPTVREKKINLIVSDKAFRGGDETRPGSFAFEKNALEGMSNKLTILDQFNSIDMLEALLRAAKGIPVVHLTRGEANQVTEFIRQNPNGNLAKIMPNVRMVILPDLSREAELGKAGIPFIREIEAAGIKLAITTPEDISGKTTRAAELREIMSRLTGNKAIDWEMLGALISAKSPDPASYAERVASLLKNLQIKIQPYKADEGVRERRQLLWSV